MGETELFKTLNQLNHYIVSQIIWFRSGFQIAYRVSPDLDTNTLLLKIIASCVRESLDLDQNFVYDLIQIRTSNCEL